MKSSYKIRGMSCNHCKEKIESHLRATKGITSADVILKKNLLNLVHEDDVHLVEIKRQLEEMGYELVEKQGEEKEIPIGVVVGIAFGGYWLLSKVIPDFSTLLTEGTNLSLLMLFVIGVTTSFHCISMCGGIALSQVTREKDNLKRNMMYNLGRIISYTVLGGIVGLFGSGITLGNNFFSVVPIILGGVMVVIGLGNAQIIKVGSLSFMQRFNYKLARIRGNLTHNQGPFILGLVNGLMPCGPLQLMQIYALSTGSFIQGALAMLAFSLGTVPMMLGLGILINRLSIKAKELVFKLGGFLVIFLGMSMISNGLATLGIAPSSLGIKGLSEQSTKQVVLEEGYQVIEVEVGPQSYEDVVVEKGIPVRMILNVRPGYLTGCNYAVNIPEYGIFAGLQEGENIIEFMPEEVGKFMFTCWMGMIRNTITVVEDIENYVPSQESSPYPPLGAGNGFRCH